MHPNLTFFVNKSCLLSFSDSVMSKTEPPNYWVIAACLRVSDPAFENVSSSRALLMVLKGEVLQLKDLAVDEDRTTN